MEGQFEYFGRKLENDVAFAISSQVGLLITTCTMFLTDNQVMYNSAVFLIWTVTSFLCHFCAKAFLVSVTEMWETDISDVWKNVWSAGVLTLVQTALCYVCVDVVKSAKENSSVNIARVTHLAATFATNFSLTFMFASSTLAIKLMEPITSAVTQFCIFRTPMSPMAVLSLPGIVGGAITFSGNPLSDMTFSMGFGAAFLSNVILAFRNLAIKNINSTDQSSLKLKVQRSQMIALSPTLLAGSSFLLYLENLGYFRPPSLFAFAMCLLSGVFHVAYSYVSTGLVLTRLSVVSHAVANIMKRVLVVLLLYAVGKRVATPYNFLGLVVCTLGLLLYTWDKRSALSRKTAIAGDQNPKKIKTPWSCLLIAPWCLIAIWTAAQVLPASISHSPSSASLLRHILEKRQAVDASTAADESNNHSQVSRIYDSLFDLKFGPNSLTRPDIWQLYPDLHDYPTNESANVTTFLHNRVIDNPAGSNYLSQKLRTSTGVIKEAQRIHYNMLEKEIGSYKYCMLLDTADFENKGDSAIAMGEIYFIARLGVDLVYYCNTPTCTGKNLDKIVKMAKNYSPRELVILLHGGGNINAYHRHDEIRFAVFEKLRGFKFFMFPQSILMTNPTDSHFQRCVRNYCCNNNLTMILRDHQSYLTAKKYFNGTTRLLLAPDMAFHIGPVTRFMSPVFDILWIKRSDNETLGYGSVPQHPQHLRLHVSDWIKFNTPQAGCSLEKSLYSTVMGLFFTQRGRVVVTDRLHGHIFATLLDIPHVLLDNKVKKLSSYHNSWTRGVENTRLANSPGEAMSMALELLQTYGEQIPPRTPWLNVSTTFQHINYSLPEMNIP